MTGKSTVFIALPKWAVLRLGLTLALSFAFQIIVVPGLADAAVPSSIMAGWSGQSSGRDVRLQLNSSRRDINGSIANVVNSAGKQVGVAEIVEVRKATVTVRWTGRDRAGEPLTPGSYTIEVSHGSRSNERNRSGDVPTMPAIIASSPFVVREPPVTVWTTKVSRGMISRQRSHRKTSIGFRVSHSGRIGAAVVDQNGRVVKNIRRGSRLKKGPGVIEWDGRDEQGKILPDARYEVLLSGVAKGVPANTAHVPVLVDTARPKMSLKTSATGSSRATIRLRVSEGGRVTIRAFSKAGKGKKWTKKLAKGKHELSISTADIGLGSSRHPASVRTRVAFIDGAGNRAEKVLQVRFGAAVDGGDDGGGGGGSSDNPPDVNANLIWPVAGPVTSEFGMRWGRMHEGIDIGVSTGTPISASDSGTVSFAGEMGGYGNFVIIDHPGGLSTAYAHLSRIDTVVGSIVAKGSTIGLAGNTGHSRGPHLHFETRVNGVAYNPRNWLPAR